MSARMEELLKRLDGDATLEDLIAERRPEGLTNLVDRAALVRWFDADVAGLLARSLENRKKETASFEALCRHRDVERVPRQAGRWTVRPGARKALLDGWLLRGDAPRMDELRDVSRTLVKHFDNHGTGASMEALFHRIALDREDALSRAQTAFSDALERFDLALCQELLDLFDERAALLDRAAVARLNAMRARLAAHELWAGERYQTRHFQTRDRLDAAFQAFLDSPEKWLLQIHARGGMGKTSFLRWVLAHRFAGQVPVARIDLDAVHPGALEKMPGLILVELAAQLDVQFRPSIFHGFLSRTPRDRHRILRFGGSFAAAAAVPADALVSGFTAPLEDAAVPRIVLIVDTLEDALLYYPKAVEGLIAVLAQVQLRCPAVKVVLSGRYPLQSRLPEFIANHGTVTEELHVDVFEPDEATAYLTRRGVTAADLLETVVRRSGRNPFKLALYADLIRRDSSITAATIERYGDADLMYLIERVLERIDDPAVRWVLRYGAIPRRFDKTLIDQVLRKHIEAAMRGADDDAPGRDDGVPHDKRARLWPVDANSARLDADALWAELSRFENRPAWVSVCLDDADALELHPETRDPMRQLIRSQPAWRKVLEDLAAYYRQRAADEPGRWAAWTAEAIRCLIQLEPARGEQALREAGAAARQKQREDWWVEVATEVIEAFDGDARARAQLERAAAGVAFAEALPYELGEGARADARRALEQALDRVDALDRRSLATVLAALAKDEQERVQAQEMAPVSAAEPGKVEAGWLEMLYFLDRRGGRLSLDNAQALLHRAATLREATSACGVWTALALAAEYAFQGRYDRALEVCERARKAATLSVDARLELRCEVLLRELRHAMGHGASGAPVLVGPLDAHGVLAWSEALEMAEIRVQCAELVPAMGLERINRLLGTADASQKPAAHALKGQLRVGMLDLGGLEDMERAVAAGASPLELARLHLNLGDAHRAAALVGEYRSPDPFLHALAGTLRARIALRTSDAAVADEPVDYDLLAVAQRVRVAFDRLCLLATHRTYGSRVGEHAQIFAESLLILEPAGAALHILPLPAPELPLPESIVELTELLDTKAPRASVESVRDDIQVKLILVRLLGSMPPMAEETLRSAVGRVAMRRGWEACREALVLSGRHKGLGKGLEDELMSASHTRGAWWSPAVATEIARQRYDRDDLQGAREALERAAQAGIASLMPLTRWSADHAVLSADLGPAHAAAAHRARARELYEQLGDTVTAGRFAGTGSGWAEATGWVQLDLVQNTRESLFDVAASRADGPVVRWSVAAARDGNEGVGVPQPIRGPISSFLANDLAHATESVAQKLGVVLTAGQFVALAPADGSAIALRLTTDEYTAALPWELARLRGGSTLAFERGIAHMHRCAGSPQPAPPVNERRALVLQPRAHQSSNLEAVVSRGLKETYGNAGFVSAASDVLSPGQFSEFISLAAPIVHVRCGFDRMQEWYLDFGDSIHVPFPALKMLLTAHGTTPVVVLDATRPGSPREAFHQLLLRNAVAAKLLEERAAHAVIAVGPTSEDDHAEMARTLLEPLLGGHSVGDTVRRLRRVDRGNDVDSVLAYRAVALFTSDPDWVPFPK